MWLPTNHHDRHSHSAVVSAEGHLVDSQQLKAIFDKVIERGGAFEVQHFQLGRTQRRVFAADAEGGGAERVRARRPARGAAAVRLPCGRRAGRHRARGREGRLRAGRLLFHDQPADRMFGSAAPGSKSSVSAWMPSSCCGGPRGVPQAARGPGRRPRRVRPRRHPRHARSSATATRADFGFMTNEISSERRVEASVGRIAAMMRHIGSGG